MIGQSWAPLYITGTAFQMSYMEFFWMLPIPELYILAHLVENEESVLQCYALRQRGEVVSIFPISNLTFAVFFILFHPDDNFSFGAPFSNITESFKPLIERVDSINNRADFTSYTKLRDGNQVFIILWNHQDADIPASCSFYPRPQE